MTRLDSVPATAVALLADCTTDPSDNLRLNAVLALRKAPAATTTDVMEHLLDDPNPRVRLVAAGSLLAGNPAHTSARGVAEAAQGDPSPRVRQAAEELIQSVPAPAAPAEVVVLTETPAVSPA